MSAIATVLVSHVPTQHEMFHVSPERIAAAKARAGSAAEGIEFVIADAGSDAFRAALPQADAVIGWNFATRDLAAAPRLKLVQLTSAGLDHLLPLDWLPAGATIINASGIHARKAEEWGMMALLALNIHVPHFTHAARSGAWSRRFEPAILGRPVLVLGTGGIGAAIGRGAQRLGCVVTGLSRSGSPVAGFDRVAPMSALMAELPKADFVVLALPLTPQTRDMFGAEQFAALKRGAGFANIGRGALVDQAALIAALQSDHLSGAVLDVTRPEPAPPGDPLWQAPNLIVTPHISCDDPLTYTPEVLDLFFTNVARLAAGQDLLNRVDPAMGY
ncbi:D-2-hydroxyacid dehydrogenase [Zavarzinia sp. CC-PAN008]|uniref:D-2-hydroxyacid dehydrogenase n=1 Tax=Zavarzinia sp. CC-PAN008 TaxID=3243332 RepID=UPI003F749D43